VTDAGDQRQDQEQAASMPSRFAEILVCAETALAGDELAVSR
jgi:hypothetical protein